MSHTLHLPNLVSKLDGRHDSREMQVPSASQWSRLSYCGQLGGEIALESASQCYDARECPQTPGVRIGFRIAHVIHYMNVNSSVNIIIDYIHSVVHLLSPDIAMRALAGG